MKKCEGASVTRTATDCAGPTVTTFTYDALNRTVQVGKTGLGARLHTYDDEGRRIRTTAGSLTTEYLYDGPDIVAEYATWASPEARYTHGPNWDDPILRTAGSLTQYYHQDGLGSVVALTNPDGTTAATARYDAWGRTVESSGAIPRFGYTGREPDATGLIYYRARYYDPMTGRFTQRDPLGLAAGPNPYAYAANSPVRLTDPRGLDPSDPAQQTQLQATQGYISSVPGGQTSGQQSMQVGPGQLYRVELDDIGRVSTATPVAAVTTRDLAPNGIWQDLNTALETMRKQVLALDPQVTSFTLFHIPDEGAVDLFASVRDKLGCTTPIARQFAAILGDLQASGQETRVTAFSRGGIILSEAVRVHIAGGGGPLSNIVQVQCNGCASNEWVAKSLFAAAGMPEPKYNNNYLDVVPSVLGFNGVLDPVRVFGSILLSPFLGSGSRWNQHVYP